MLKFMFYVMCAGFCYDVITSPEGILNFIAGVFFFICFAFLAFVEFVNRLSS